MHIAVVVIIGYMLRVLYQVLITALQVAFKMSNGFDIFMTHYDCYELALIFKGYILHSYSDKPFPDQAIFISVNTIINQ